MHLSRLRAGLPTAIAALLATACATPGDGALPRLAPARAGALATAGDGTLAASCAALASRLSFARTAFASAELVAAGVLVVAGQPAPAHCRVVGEMNARTSAVDGQRYAIGFELRLPERWNGRFYYQANGGVDGSVVPATGLATAGPAGASALVRGFAVISSDAGHATAQNGTFGQEPDARLDYGYRAVAALTPMAKAAIRSAYGRGPDRSYIGGCSNGGRHALVAASRLPGEYDGYLVGDPGTVLPRAAIANLAGGRAYAELAAAPDLGNAFTVAERRLVSDAVLQRCDALDGVRDGLVQDTAACQSAFDLARDVPTCAGARDGTCLAPAQKATIERLFRGVAGRDGRPVYSRFPWDAGLATADWAGWKFTSPSTRDAGAVAGIFQVPPTPAAGFDGRAFMMAADVDALLARVQATDATYAEPALAFMNPPRLDDLSALRARGAKVVLYHGTSDPIFSSDHTVSVYESWRRGPAGDRTAETARLFLVPGMNHCRSGPSTDQFDLLGPLVEWVEGGTAPTAVTASARGPGNPAGANADVPASWSATRTRPLCPYPQVARYVGGDVEQAASFACR